MKKLILICVLVLSLASCSLGDDTPDFQNEFVPIESVDIPAEFTLGEIYEIKMTYLRPTTCHAFNDFYYRPDSNIRTVAVINTVYNASNCEPLDNEEVEVSFDFRPTNTGSYIFKFWQGEDATGEDLYYVVEVPVVD